MLSESRAAERQYNKAPTTWCSEFQQAFRLAWLCEMATGLNQVRARTNGLIVDGAAPSSSSTADQARAMPVGS
jgi:hypothetical protein